MSSLPERERLQAALGDRYVIERELGRGGMATVWLARDARHGRQVAVKLLHAELRAGVAPERFEREVRLTASLQHPHILPLLDSGIMSDADGAPGTPFYVMPFVTGESLRARLDRERQLAESDAIAIAVEAASALGYAHRAGVVHRDVKPENILLADGQALVADFGIALAAEGDGRLTSTGMIVGTPRYMSPEQAAGDRMLDGRSDQYALACVLYEMLAGEPPFVAASAQSLIAKHLADPAPSVRRLRAGVSPATDVAIQRALAKAPGDRFPAMGDFAAALKTADRGGSLPGAASGAEPTRAVQRAPAAAGNRGPRRIRVGALAALAVGVAGLGAVLGTRLWRRPAREPALDAHRLAVLPFRVVTSDAELAYLGEGMVDLLAIKFTGEGGLRAVDPRAALSAWHRAGDVPDAVERAARAVGAGLALDGSVVGSARRLTVTASLRNLGRPGDSASTTTEAGPADSLPQLLDRVAARLLASRAGGTVSLGSLTTLPALRAYLDGVARYRHGHYHEAARALDRALDLDSTFIYAALALLPARARIGDALALHHDPAAIVWRNRDRFSPADRAIALAYLGPSYPGVSSQIALIAAWRAAVAAAPENADAWFTLGDVLLHFGALNDVPRPVEEARLAFGRAIALDSDFIFPIDHALLAAFELRDTAAIRTLLPLLLTRDSTSDIAVFSRWRAAIALGDSATLVRIRAALPGASEFSLIWIYNLAQHQAVGLGDGYRALELLRARATAPQQIQRLRDDARTFLLNLGRPRESLAQLAPDDTAAAAGRWRVVVEQLWDDGDSALAVSAAASLARALHAPAAAPADRGFAACALGFRLARRRAPDSLPALTRELRALPLPADTPPFVHDDAVYCAAVLDAWYAALLHDAAAGTFLARADSIGIASTTTLFLPGFLAEAEIANLERDTQFALRVLRRRPVALPGFTELRAGFFLGRARAAAAVGQTAEAREAYGDYLRLRADPEPSLRPVTDSVRAELARLGP